MAGVLTENLVLQKTKVDNIQRVRKLNVCAAQLSDIGVLRRACNLEILSLSLNELSELGVLENCRRLSELYLRKNRLEDLNQVLHLSDSPHLTVLTLAENPICQDPNYRRFVIAAISSLRRLDDIDILPQEREDAYRVFPNLHSIAPPPSIYCDPVKGKVRPAVAPQRNHAAGPTKFGLGSNQGKPRYEGGGADFHDDNNVRGKGEGRSPRRSPARGGTVKRKHPNTDSPHYSYAEPPHYNNPSKRPHSGNGRMTALPMPSIQIGPTETGVVQAVKVLLSELSAESLDEVRRFIDALQ